MCQIEEICGALGFFRSGKCHKRDLLRISCMLTPGADAPEMSLLHEQTTFGDLLLLDCEEGYGEGRLRSGQLCTVLDLTNASIKLTI